MFESRDEAGLLLGEYLMGKETPNTIVVGIPRGGVVVAIRVARMLNISFDAVLVKKIVSPVNPEFALGAAGESGEVYWDEESVKSLSEWNKKEALKETLIILHQREKLVRAVYAEKEIEGKDVILVDDGIATGATVVCARTVLQGKGAKNISLATPVIANDTYKILRKEFDSIYALQIPIFFDSVGQFYKNFPQVRDEEVLRVLKNVWL